jgi:hypothetical protein
MILSRLLLLVLSLYSASVLAQNYDGTRIANRTIEKVRPDIPLDKQTETVLVFVCFLQTVQLRTHSLFAPYIDQDLQNRYALGTY